MSKKLAVGARKRKVKGQSTPKRVLAGAGTRTVTPTSAAERHEGLAWVRGSGVSRQWNGIQYKLGLSGKNVGSTQLSMNVAVVPPGAVAFAHVHVGFEVMLYILEGRVRHEYGPELRYQVDHQAGDFIFIEPGVPHEVLNLSDTEPVVAVVARSSAAEWDEIVDYPSGRRPAH